MQPEDSFIRARHRSLPWARRIHSITSHRPNLSL